MVDHLKCICYMFQHIVVVQYTKQCFYWIPHPRKYVCGHQDNLSCVDYCRRYSQSGDFRERAHGGPLKMYILYILTYFSGPIR